MTNSSPSAPKLSRKVVIVNELGLHARSAAKIAGIAQKSQAAVWVERDAQKADASSIVDILTLACEKGSEIRLIIEDKADREILEDLANLIESGFGE